MSRWGQIPLEVEERARRRAFERYRQDCAGIRVLRRLEREGLAPGTFRHAILTRQLEALPRLFERKRELDRRLRAREISLDQHRRELTLLLREHGLPPGYALGSEAQELARARCALSEYWWRQFADQRRLDPAGCRDLQRRLEQARARLAAAVRALEQQRGQLHETRWRLERLRCAGWPPGGRPPREWPGWCREVRDRIARLEAAIAELAKREAAARDEVISLDLAHEQGCLMERRLREAW